MWCQIDNPKGFKLEYHFETNPFFKNSVLTKTYLPIDEDEPILEKAIGQVELMEQDSHGRGLADRSSSVLNECLKLMKDEWLAKCSNEDPIKLINYLDVETYESVGESVMSALLKAGLVKLQDGKSIRQFIVSTSDSAEDANKLQNVELDGNRHVRIWVE